MRSVRRAGPRAPAVLGPVAAGCVLLCGCTATTDAGPGGVTPPPAVPATATPIAAGPAGGSSDNSPPTTGTSTPPTPTAPAGAPTGTGAEPTLGSPGDPRYTYGYGSVRPVEIDNGHDPTLVIGHITWNSWGGPTALGSGTSYRSPPNGVGAGYAPATVEAYDLGTCQGHPAYLEVKWWFPTHGETFDHNHSETTDTCHATPPPTTAPPVHTTDTTG